MTPDLHSGAASGEARMTENHTIPDDIRKAAYDCARGIYLNVDDGGTPYMTDDDILEVAKAINDAVMAERERDQWQAIETAPNEGPFLAYGSYLYPGDKGVTEYTSIVERSGDPAWPWSTPEGNAAKEAFSHWMPLPAAPKSEG